MKPIALRHRQTVAPVTPARVTPTEPGLALCTCGHERRRHGRHGCWQRLDGRYEFGGRGRRRCPCVRFVEAEFARQQIQLFAERANAIEG